MFKQSNEELKRLEEQLLAVEEPKVEEADFDLLYEDLLQEFGPDQVQTAPARKTHRNVNQATDYTDNAKQHKAHKKHKKRKSIRGLLITLGLECLGIVLVLLWWVLRIL